MYEAHIHCTWHCIFFKFTHRAKHPVKVHVWAGISHRWATGICIFEDTMKAPLYTQIFDETLVPFAADVFSEGFRFMQDSGIQRNNLNWWKTPAESSDLNPIENLWHKERVCETWDEAQDEQRTDWWHWNTLENSEQEVCLLHTASTKVIPRSINWMCNWVLVYNCWHLGHHVSIVNLGCTIIYM